MLAEVLVAELRHRDVSLPVDLEERLVGIVQDARAAWRLEVDGRTFIAFVADRWPESATLEDWLRNAHLRDLYLACACSQNLPGAIETFARVYLSQVPDYLARSAPDASLIDDVRQLLCDKLFVGDARKINTYSGRGALGAWVRMLAVRACLDLRR